MRSNPVFKLLADCLPDDDDLASQPRLSRFENSITPASLLRLEDWFIDRFVNSFSLPPREVTLDIDVFDDPTHGQQQLTLFRGFYNQYQYLVRVITCAGNDLVVLPALLHGTADPAVAADDDLERIVRRLQEKFPRVLIRLRADSGFAKPCLYRTCERLGVEYSVGLAANLLVLRRHAIANPPAEEHSGSYLDQDVVPVEARSGRARRRHFNRRRKTDPLGEGHASTWRTRLIKVAVRITVTARRVWVLLSGACPYLNHFRDVGGHSPPPKDSSPPIARSLFAPLKSPAP